MRVPSLSSWMRLCGSSILMALPVFAQTTAAITGEITDTSGGAVANCTVHVTNEATGQSRSTTTSGDGAYVFTLLSLGTYRVEAEASGFKKAVRTGVLLSVQENVRIDFQLSLGAVTEVISVDAEAPMVDTRQASVGALMDSK